jgi:nitrogen fixation/metabolism regulation signal transduction histidine kinase
LGVTLVVFTAFSLVLARSIAKPLEKLTETARRIARGDLSARSKARAAGGTGLGLNLCQRIVEAHGGEIEAERRSGGGLTVRISFLIHG